jgi:hypothetical protein
MLINDGHPFHSRDAHEHFASFRAFHEAHRLGQLRWLAHRLSVDASVPDSRALRAEAARIVVPEHAIACDDYAALIHGASTRPPARRHELRPMYLVPHTTYRSRKGYALVRQSTDIPDSDIVEIDGVLVTSPLRTATDLLRRSYRPHALAAGDAMARANLVTRDELCGYICELHRLPGLCQAQEIAARVDPLAESPGESWQRCRILDAGFPCPALQTPVTDSWGIVRRLDMAYENLLAASEYDGREFHTAAHDQALDSARRTDLSRRGGWRFNLGTWERIFGTSPDFEYELGEFIGATPKPRQWY